jgi:hypothetical protein
LDKHRTSKAQIESVAQALIKEIESSVSLMLNENDKQLSAIQTSQVQLSEELTNHESELENIST